MSKINPILHKQTSEFAKSISEIILNMSGANPVIEGEPQPTNSLELNMDITVSIFFVGSVFGEFIFSLSNETAKAIVQPLGVADDDHQGRIDAISEILNMASGGQLKSLAKHYSKLTITSPRTTLGKIKYPSVHAMQTTLKLNDQIISVGMYLDEMKLDLYESYKSSVDQLKIANNELISANEKLKLQQMQLIHSEKLASLGTMAAGVAHEINNPLSFVMSNSDVLQSYIGAFNELFTAYHGLLHSIQEKNSKQASSDLRKVKSLIAEKDLDYILQDTSNLISESRSGLDRIKKIVNSLKLFSRVDEAGSKKVQINNELNNALQLIANELKYKCKVEFLSGDIPEIECVPNEIGQVFINLMLNACQAIPDTGGNIVVKTEKNADGIIIKVEDDGCGISKENVAKIFDPFFTTKPVGQGTGLGLAITHSIIKKHGGSIDVQSEPNAGTKFTVFLPWKMPEKSAEEQAKFVA